jgi:hypothetical protein
MARRELSIPPEKATATWWILGIFSDTALYRACLKAKSNIVYILSAYINANPSRRKNHLYMLQNRFSDRTVLEENDRREDRS